MIHLDTHVVVWLGIGRIESISAAVLDSIEAEAIAVSPMVEFEMAFLHEIGRLADRPANFLAGLRRSIGLEIDPTPFAEVAELAAGAEFAFTRDPFDRVIAAQATAAGARLATRDRALRDHLDAAFWD